MALYCVGSVCEDTNITHDLRQKVGEARHDGPVLGRVCL